MSPGCRLPTALIETPLVPLAFTVPVAIPPPEALALTYAPLRLPVLRLLALRLRLAALRLAAVNPLFA